MTDIKIPGGQLGRVTAGAGPGGVQANAELLPPGIAKKIDAPPPADAFKGQLPLAGEAEQLTGQTQGPQVPAFALAAEARQVQNPAEAQAQFQAAYDAVKDQLLDPGLTQDALGQRANEFFTEFARAFVETTAEQAPPPPPPEQPEGSVPDRPAERQVSPEQQRLAREFADSLKELGFQALKNLANGKDGVENAFQLLTSEGLQEFADQAKEQMIAVQGEFPPKPAMEGRESLQSPPEAGAEKKEIGEGPTQLDEQGAAERASQDEEDLGLPDGTHASEEEEEEEGLGTGKRKRKKNMLWSWLKTFRRNDESVRQAEEKWDRVTVAALLFLLLLALLTVALVNL